MKILGGQYRGRNFYMPAEIRPTQGLLRQAVFDLIGHDIEGLSFLELYAGSGAVSLEAISRGAGSAVLVEKDPKNAQIIRENFELLGIEMGDKFRLIQGDALATIKDLGEKKKQFDIVFYDPPFGRRLGKKTLKLIDDNDILHALSFVIAQYDKSEKLEVPESLTVVTDKLYGSSHLTILQKVK
jgi:16S rRNA (guanine966-N2)-methyltransferase